jgi:hypothetical protein
MYCADVPNCIHAKISPSYAWDNQTSRTSLPKWLCNGDWRVRTRCNLLQKQMCYIGFLYGLGILPKKFALSQFEAKFLKWVAKKVESIVEPYLQKVGYGL